MPALQESLPADLFIGKKLDCRIGNNPYTVGAVALEHALDALFVIHMFATLQVAAAPVSYCNSSASSTLYKWNCIQGKLKRNMLLE